MNDAEPVTSSAPTIIRSVLAPDPSARTPPVVTTLKSVLDATLT